MNKETVVEGFVFINEEEEDLMILCIEKNTTGPVIKLKKWGPELDNSEICLSWEKDVVKYLYGCNHYSNIELTEYDISKLYPAPATLENGIIYI